MSPHDPGYLLPRRATRLAFAGLLLGMLLAVLNQTIIATALPHIVADLGGMDHYSWVFTAYMLGSTVTIPIWGRLSDIYGRRRFFAAGIVIFMGGGIVGATADSMLQLIAARGIQGIGAGALIPLAIASIGDLVPPSDRGRWQGLVGAVIGIGAGLGPITGGWIADHIDWPWVFIVSLPFGLVALAVVMVTLRIPPHPERATSVDYRGAALLAGGLSALLLAIVEVGGDLDVAGLLIPLAIAVALLVRLRRPLALGRRADRPDRPVRRPPVPRHQRDRLLRRRGDVRRDHVRPAVRPGRAGRERHLLRARDHAADPRHGRRQRDQRPRHLQHRPLPLGAALRAAGDGARLRAAARPRRDLHHAVRSPSRPPRSASASACCSRTS